MSLSNPMRALIKKAAKTAAPPKKLTVSEWADADRRLPQESAAEAGRWKTDRAPYQRGIMDAFSDPTVTRVVCQTSAQTGKTEILLNVAGSTIANDPKPCLIVMPSLVLAEAFSKDRLAPMIRETPSLRKKVSEAKDKSGENTILHKKFRGGQITIAGANSPRSLASRPISLVLLDEVSGYETTREGDAVTLAIARTKTFRNKKIGAFSTPTTKGICRINQMFLESDQRFFNLPCPHCGELIVLKFDRFKWDQGKPETVVYLCNLCDAIIEEKEKPRMLKLGRWVATQPFTGTAGFHVWEAYSPWVPWTDIITNYLESKKSSETYRAFVNTSLGEVYEESGEAPDWKKLYDRREPYKVNTLNDDVHFILSFCDVQADRLEVEIVGVGRMLRTWSVDYRVFRGPTSTPNQGPWVELEKLLAETWVKPNGNVLPIRMMGVDSGYQTQTVYNFVRKFPANRVIATKGRETLGTIVGLPTKVDVTVAGKKLKRGVNVWPIGVNIVKSELFGWLKQEHVKGEPEPYGFTHFPEYDEEYFKMLTAEELVTVKDRRGFPKQEFRKTRERNEVLDIKVGLRALMCVTGLDRFRDADWTIIECSQPQAIKSKTSTSGTPDDKPTAQKRRPKRESSIW